MSTPSPTPFTFDTVFNAQGGVEDPQARTRPRHSDEVLEQTRAEAFAEGAEAGRAEALGGQLHQVADTLAQVAERLQGLDQTHARAIEEIRGDAAQLAHRIATILASTLVRRAPSEEILTLAGDCLARLPMEPRIVLRVSEAIVEEIGERIDEVTARVGFSGAVVLLGEPDLAAGECRIEWPDGGVERDPRALAAEVEDIIKRHCETWSPDRRRSDKEIGA